VTFFKDRNNLLLGPLHVYGLTSRSNIAVDLEAEYQKLSPEEFKKWNRKRKRGFRYTTYYIKHALKSLRNFNIDEDKTEFFVPKSNPKPLLIAVTSDLYLVVAPRETIEGASKA